MMDGTEVSGASREAPASTAGPALAGSVGEAALDGAPEPLFDPALDPPPSARVEMGGVAVEAAGRGGGGRFEGVFGWRAGEGTGSALTATEGVAAAALAAATAASYASISAGRVHVVAPVLCA